MDLILREAQEQDVPAVIELIRELADFEGEPHEVEITHEELLKDGFGAQPAFQIFIAEKEAEIVGMAFFYERYSTWKGRSLHLEDLIVRKQHRNNGVGMALYSKVMHYAVEQGIKRVSWEVLDWNTVAIDFYESTGAKILQGWQVVQMQEKALKEFVNNN